ncbi:MAG: TonB family protein [Crocinitomicaceae bacterium]
MITALIEVNIYCCLLAVIYFGFRNFLKSTTRRFFLCIIPIAAVGVFILKNLLQSNNSLMPLPVIELDIVTIGATIQSDALNTNLFFSINGLYWIGVALFISYTLVKVFSVLSYFKNSEFLFSKKVWLTSTDHQQSFTFLNRIHLSNLLDPEDKAIVLEHELLHVKHKHSLDLLLLELYHAFYWFNPVLFLIKRELICVHEYQVDQSMYNKHDKTYLKHLLASSMGVNSSQILLTSQFYNGLSLTQRKKQMKTKKKNNWAVVAIIPFCAMALAFVSFTNRKNVIPNMAIVEQDSVYDKVEKMPEFKGGQSAMIDFIVKNVKYPEKAKKNGIEGTVYMKFTVKTDGRLADISSAKKVNELLDAEGVRVIKLMPKWVPGEKDGKKVAVQYVLPIKFKLPE